MPADDARNEEHLFPIVGIGASSFLRQLRLQRILLDRRRKRNQGLIFRRWRINCFCKSTRRRRYWSTSRATFCTSVGERAKTWNRRQAKLTGTFLPWHVKACVMSWTLPSSRRSRKKRCDRPPECRGQIHGAGHRGAVCAAGSVMIVFTDVATPRELNASGRATRSSSAMLAQMQRELEQALPASGQPTRSARRKPCPLRW